MQNFFTRLVRTVLRKRFFGKVTSIFVSVTMLCTLVGNFVIPGVQAATSTVTFSGSNATDIIINDANAQTATFSGSNATGVIINDANDAGTVTFSGSNATDHIIIDANDAGTATIIDANDIGTATFLVSPS